MNLEEASENFDKQSRVLVNNIQGTKYKFDKDIKELTAKDIE